MRAVEAADGAAAPGPAAGEGWRIARSTVAIRRPEGPSRARLALVSAADGVDWERMAVPALHPAELIAFRRFPAPARRRSYLLGRMAAKLAAADFLGGAGWRDREIRNGVLGDPRIVGGAEAGISLSHSASSAAALAFGPGHPMGIDIEPRDRPGFGRLRQYFGERELAAVSGPSGLPETPALALLWTMKEALAKVLRVGLGVSPNLLEVDGIERLGEEGWVAGYSHFRPFRCFAFRHGGLWVSIAHPKESILGLGPCCYNFPAGASLADQEVE